MRGFFRLRRSELDLETRLRRGRPEPREEFLQSVADRVRPQRRARLPLRLAVAATLTGAFLVALASVGGFGYAIAAAKQAASSVQGQQPQQQPEPQSGKTTICHRTASDSNPYVMITVDNSALDAHRRHPPQGPHSSPQREDIIPAPPEGCPTGEPPPPSEDQYGKTTICHRTASDKNPYVQITVSNSALDAHRQHPPQNGRSDIIPAPPGGCPTS